MRLLFDHDWYEPVSSEGQRESDFEDLVIGNATSLFPDFHAVRFKIPVESEEGRKIPDLALVDYNYRYWWVVEVEMAHHSLERHVIPQVEVFSRGKYGQKHCDYLVDNGDALDHAALSDMIKGAQPRVLVVVNRSVPEWKEPIRRLEGLIAVVEVFRSERNRQILRINGDYPSTSDASVVTYCRLDSAIPRLLQIDSPAGLGIGSGERLSILLDGGLTNWARLDIQDKVWLIPLERNPLTASQEYLILKEVNGQYAFKRVQESR